MGPDDDVPSSSMINSVGESVGTLLGYKVVGITVGRIEVGSSVGCFEGISVGDWEGGFVGDSVWGRVG